MSERLINGPGVELCTQSFGEAGQPPILMIMGATASMVWWPDELMGRLAEAGRFVVRYDHRDTGRSTTFPPGVTPYSIDDLADDALAVLDAHELTHAHMVGMSLGGLIAQLLALRNADRVLSLTLIASEMYGDPGFESPPISPAILSHFDSAGALDWKDEIATTEFLLELWRLSSGSSRPFEADRVRRTAEREVRRARSLQSMLNHARLIGGAEWYGRTSEIAQPMLVIHGSDDPVVPYLHGHALASATRSARLVPLEGAGHELHTQDWSAIVEAIVTHTAHCDRSEGSVSG